MNPERDTTYELISWDKFYRQCIDLADQIKQSSFKPNILLGIARGGWVIARILSDLLGIHEVANIRVKFYTDIYKTEREPIITQPVSLCVENKEVLLIDDVSDSGKSLRIALEHTLAKNSTNCKTATIHYKPWSILKPDYFVAETDLWIIYPHEFYETLNLVAGKMVKEGKTKAEVYQLFVDLGAEKDILQKFLDEIMP
ncbi:MAG: phosphoribosyltransferase [Candidatus Hodarchaeota archaeon]